MPPPVPQVAMIKHHIRYLVDAAEPIVHLDCRAFTNPLVGGFTRLRDGSSLMRMRLMYSALLIDDKRACIISPGEMASMTSVKASLSRKYKVTGLEIL